MAELSATPSLDWEIIARLLSAKLLASKLPYGGTFGMSGP